MSKGKEIIESAKAEVKAKNQVTYTRKQIVVGTFKVVILLVVGIAIGVFAQRSLDSAVHAQVVSEVQQLKN
jgi:hypothetical protein